MSAAVLVSLPVSFTVADQNLPKVPRSWKIYHRRLRAHHRGDAAHLGGPAGRLVEGRTSVEAASRSAIVHSHHRPDHQQKPRTYSARPPGPAAGRQAWRTRNRGNVQEDPSEPAFQ